jgi:hypothetical protein
VRVRRIQIYPRLNSRDHADVVELVDTLS